ncbi:hypothetical protein HYH03_004870 [Edaphochlamys debaryana]|uniref:DNA mismatch repair proteins mutS family domain-containing protein n=1 Tax=Edaphochlamys debaryana TaxID=47281 RepID=A0A835Y954_9CHLO|nr:hypothetical protein HYH03_004870 [Edaphochlamys debaryana]|eukprot:KAG2497287.1 hypothetical protein HYH03_004870 [Edaphochlamys debaryana]
MPAWSQGTRSPPSTLQHVSSTPAATPAPQGTLASDGVGLTSALLQYFAAGGAAGALGAPSDQATITSPCTAGAGPAGPPPPPRLILATHFHELFRPGVLPPCRHLAFLQMEVLTQRLPPPQAQHGPGTGAGAGAGPGARSGAAAQGLLEAAGQGRVEAGEAGEEDEHEHVFLYRLVPGRCPASFGVHCARLAGVDEAVCVRAKEVIAALQRGGTVGRWRGVTRSAAVQGELAALERLKAAAALPAAERNVALCAILRGSDAPTGGEEQGPEAAAP